MKVRELIEALEACDADAEVHFSYDYGDYWHTPVAPRARHVESSGPVVVWSEYHRMPKLVDDDRDVDEYRHKEGFDENVVVIT
jgi:hypothetical protein